MHKMRKKKPSDKEIIKEVRLHRKTNAEIARQLKLWYKELGESSNVEKATHDWSINGILLTLDEILNCEYD